MQYIHPRERVSRDDQNRNQAFGRESAPRITRRWHETAIVGKSTPAIMYGRPSWRYTWSQDDRSGNTGFHILSSTGHVGRHESQRGHRNRLEKRLPFFCNRLNGPTNGCPDRKPVDGRVPTQVEGRPRDRGRSSCSSTQSNPDRQDGEPCHGHDQEHRQAKSEIFHAGRGVASAHTHPRSECEENVDW